MCKTVYWSTECNGKTKWLSISGGTVDSVTLFSYERMAYRHSKEWIQAIETVLEALVCGAVEWREAWCKKAWFLCIKYLLRNMWASACIYLSGWCEVGRKC